MNTKTNMTGVINLWREVCVKHECLAAFHETPLGALKEFARRASEHGPTVVVNRPVLDLRELIETQRELQARMGNPTGTGEAGFKENMLHVIVEAVEAMSEVNFKPWKAKRKEVDRDALATESTDILQFWANAVLGMGLTPEELTCALRHKWKVNYDRIDCGEVVDAHREEPVVNDGEDRS